MQRAGAIALVLAVLVRSCWAAPAPSGSPGAARAPRPSACCCRPCPAPPACPCDHARPGGSTACEKGTDDRPLAAQPLPSTGPARLACEELQRPGSPRIEPAPPDSELLPDAPFFTERIEKVPIA
ncbi:MAG TPA: hypothetical protein VJB14_09920 [Planctomycetota bacterium]|nr:hypothetical protein [Planctomycetota bacterium]